MEFVKVTFPQKRTAVIDGEPTGPTGGTLRVGRGVHTFDLGEPPNYRPKSQEVMVEGTTPLTPMTIAFTAVGAPRAAARKPRRAGRRK
jgi:hypothetical protein